MITSTFSKIRIIIVSPTKYKRITPEEFHLKKITGECVFVDYKFDPSNTRRVTVVNGAFENGNGRITHLPVWVKCVLIPDI